MDNDTRYIISVIYLFNLNESQGIVNNSVKRDIMNFVIYRNTIWRFVSCEMLWKKSEYTGINIENSNLVIFGPEFLIRI